MKSTIKTTSVIEIFIIFGPRNDRINAIIYESVRGKVAIRPVRPAHHKWEAAKKHLLKVARGCFRGNTNNGELVTLPDVGVLLNFLWNEVNTIAFRG